ncbi:MAG: radical SAM protein [Bdellovibrionales bacterium]|nr:radical SAM protein [Bdellovibrionales bacterium]
MNKDLFEKVRKKSVEQAIPLQASLELTYRCNERCTHCYIEKFQDDPARILELDDWKKILKELRSAGTLYLVLMGGEPTLSSHFFSILNYGSDLGFYMSIISNGLKIQDIEYARKLKEGGLRLATFSLYSLDPLIHDKMTSVKGSHAKLMKAIFLCRDAGIKVSLNGLLTEANAKGIFDLYEWADTEGLELKVDPNVTAKLNGDMQPTLYRASRETLTWFYRERAKRWENALPTPVVEPSNAYVCNAAKGKCAVNPYGELLPCIEIREAFGSLVEKSFAELWASDKAIKWREPKIKDLSLGEHQAIYGFCDHCPGMAKNEHGKPMQLTDYTKVVAEVKSQVFREFQRESDL